MEQIKQVFETPDGKKFDNKADAMNHLRRPKIKAALMPLVKGKEDLADWLIENQETVEVAFEQGTIRRVTKSEKNKFVKAVDYVVEKLQGDHKASFFVDNIQAVKDSFRWPSVTRMTEEEKSTAARNTLLAATENNDGLVTWIMTNKDALIQAYEAGIEKRQVNPKAQAALEEYRKRKAAEKEAEKAAEGSEKAAA